VPSNRRLGAHSLVAPVTVAGRCSGDFPIECTIVAIATLFYPNAVCVQYDSRGRGKHITSMGWARLMFVRHPDPFARVSCHSREIRSNRRFDELPEQSNTCIT
jgi:hypothetical protein